MWQQCDCDLLQRSTFSHFTDIWSFHRHLVISPTFGHFNRDYTILPTYCHFTDIKSFHWHLVITPACAFLSSMVLSTSRGKTIRFLVVSHDSIRGCVRPSVRRSVRRSVRPSVRPSVGPSVGPSVRNLFFRRAETKTANDLCRVSGLVDILPTENLIVFPSMSLRPLIHLRMTMNLWL